MINKLLAKVKKDDNGCWLWTGALDEFGYGVYGKGGGKAHRLSFKIINGFLPPYPEFELDHLCRVRNCINPDHLEVVTHQENCLRGLVGEVTAKRQLSKTHCPKGHEYSKENTYIDPKIYGNQKHPSRHCKTCKLEAHKRWRERKRNEK